jgi:hypothetical protein
MSVAKQPYRGRSFASMSFEAEIQHLVETIDVRLFQALSPGIGLGDLRTARQAASVCTATPVSQTARQETAVANVVTAAPTSVNRVNVASTTVKTPSGVKGSPWEKFFLAWSLDFFFVASCLVMVLAAACALFVYQHGIPETPLNLPPLRWLAAVSPVKVLAAVYAVFIGYAAIFRVLAGRTIGEASLGLVRKAQVLEALKKAHLAPLPDSRKR